MPILINLVLNPFKFKKCLRGFKGFNLHQNKTKMKKALKIIGLLLLLFVIYVLYIFNDTGFFRKIENSFAGKIEKKIALPGVEDMQISYEDNFILLSSDDRASRRDGKTQQGHLYYICLLYTSDAADE